MPRNVSAESLGGSERKVRSAAATWPRARSTRARPMKPASWLGRAACRPSKIAAACRSSPRESAMKPRSVRARTSSLSSSMAMSVSGEMEDQQQPLGGPQVLAEFRSPAREARRLGEQQLRGLAMAALQLAKACDRECTRMFFRQPGAFDGEIAGGVEVAEMNAADRQRHQTVGLAGLEMQHRQQQDGGEREPLGLDLVLRPLVKGADVPLRARRIPFGR